MVPTNTMMSAVLVHNNATTVVVVVERYTVIPPMAIPVQPRIWVTRHMITTGRSIIIEVTINNIHHQLCRYRGIIISHKDRMVTITRHRDKGRRMTTLIVETIRPHIIIHNHHYKMYECHNRWMVVWNRLVFRLVR